LLIWAALGKLPVKARKYFLEGDHILFFSSVSLWEIAIKQQKFPDEFAFDLFGFYRGLLANEYIELPLEGKHILELSSLPILHKDPFDRIILAQSQASGCKLLTSDKQLAEYGGDIIKI
jgi:PIN domain nuclease of toxin-antitoxin system